MKHLPCIETLVSSPEILRGTKAMRAWTPGEVSYFGGGDRLIPDELLLFFGGEVSEEELLAEEGCLQEEAMVSAA